MPSQDAHKEALLTTLVLAEELAYLLVDASFKVTFASPEAAAYGVPPQGNLSNAPEWLAGLRPRLLQLFERPALFAHTAHDQDARAVSIQARVANFDRVPRLLILLRRPGGATSRSLAPYDAITGLYSASFIEQKIDEELERLKRFPSLFSLLGLGITPRTEPSSQLSDLLRLHFRAIDIVGHAPHDGFLVVLPGATLEHARLAGARFAALVADFHVMLPAPITVSYTAIEAGASDTRATLFNRLHEAEPLFASS